MRSQLLSRCRMVLFCSAVLLIVLASFHQLSKTDFVARLGAAPALGRYRLPGGGRQSLRQVHRAPNHQLIIDPVLTYSTFLGGSNSSRPGGGSSQGASVLFVDGSGNLYVGGGTNSPNFPVTPGVVLSSNPQSIPFGFVSKIDPSGQSLLFSTYIEGLYSVTTLALDGLGNIYVGGQAISGSATSFPTLPIPPGTTPFQATAKGSNIGVLKLNSTATAILNATYLGGSGAETIHGIATDSQGNVYVAGSTTSNDFPTLNPLQGSLGSGTNMFVTELNSSLSSLVYSTYLGQSSSAITLGSPHGIAVDAAGDAYVVGGATPGFPTTSGAVQTICTAVNGSDCAVFAKLSAGGSSLSYATYLGSTNYATGVAVDSLQNAYVTGTANPDFPQANALITCDYGHAFVSELDSTETLKFSTCLGQGITYDLTLDGSGNVYVTGSTFDYTTGINVPLKNPIQADHPVGNGVSFPFVSAIDPKTPALLFSSYLGGMLPGEEDSATSVGVDSSGDIYVVGGAGDITIGTAPPFPVFNALQPNPGSFLFCLGCTTSDAFIVKIAPVNGAAAALSPTSIDFPPQQINTSSSPQAVNVIDMGSSALTVSNATVTGDFSIQNNCATVSPAGGTCTIQVTFTPTVVGASNGTLTITDSSDSKSRTVALTGTGITPSLSVAPNSLSFGSQAVGTSSSAQTVTLTNPGPLTVQIGRIGTTGDFAEANNCGGSLAQGSCQVMVTFTPTANGTRTGTLTISDNAPNSPQTVSLTGSGGSGGFTMSSSTSSATVSAGSMATYSFTATPGSGFSGSVSFTCSGAPTASTCMVSPNPLTLTGGKAANFTVTVATTAQSAAQFGESQMLSASSWPARGFSALAGSFTLAQVLLLFGLSAGTNRKRMLVCVGVLVLSAAGLGCGDGSASLSNPNGTPTGTPSGSYTITVMGTSGAVTQSTTLKLTVQ